MERLELDRYHYLHATRAELLRGLDRVEDARAAYDRALELVHSGAERVISRTAFRPDWVTNAATARAGA